MKPSVKFKLLLTKCFSVSCIHLPPNLDYLNPGYPLKQLLGNGILVTVEILVQLLTRQENKGDTAAIRQGRNMVYPGPIDPYFLAVILIPEPHFPPNFDP